MFNGRLNRSQYLVGNIYLWLPFVAPYIILGYGPRVGIQLRSEINDMTIIMYMSIWFLFAITIFFGLVDRRCHDFNKSGWTGVALWGIPLLSIVVFCIRPGTPGPNDHGFQPHGYGLLRVLFAKGAKGVKATI